MFQLILLGAFGYLVYWTIKAARSVPQQVLGALPILPCLWAWMLCPVLLPFGIGVLAALGVQVVCMGILISLGGHYRDQAMKAVLDGAELGT